MRLIIHLILCGFTVCDLDSWGISRKAKIPLRKCCTDLAGSFFSLKHNACFKLPNERYHWPPPVISSSTKQSMTVDSKDFDLIHNEFFRCPKDHLTAASDNFNLLDNGTLILPNSIYEGFPTDRFCIDALHPSEYEGPDPQKFIAVYCVPDVCKTDMICVKKCCSDEAHILIGESGGNCVLTDLNPLPPKPVNLTFQFRTEDGKTFESSQVTHVLMYGFLPSCPYGTAILELEKPNTYKFYVNPLSNELYAPAIHDFEPTLEYCIDIVQTDVHTSVNVVICKLPPLPTDVSTDRNGTAISSATHVSSAYPATLLVLLVFLRNIVVIMAREPRQMCK